MMDLAALDAGNRFVVSVTGVSSPANCGNLFTPCYDIKAAVALAANDSFVYVTPGRSLSIC